MTHSVDKSNFYHLLFTFVCKFMFSKMFGSFNWNVQSVCSCPQVLSLLFLICKQITRLFYNIILFMIVLWYANKSLVNEWSPFITCWLSTMCKFFFFFDIYSLYWGKSWPFLVIWRVESRKPERYSSAAPLSRKLIIINSGYCFLFF